MAPIAWLKSRQTALSFWVRRRRIRRAVRLARSVDGMVASRVVYLQGLQLLAGIAGKVERSGILKGQPAKFAELEAALEAVTQAFVDAMRLGDPALQLGDAQQAYVQARVRTLPRRLKRQYEYQQALQQLGTRGEAGVKERLKKNPSLVVRRDALDRVVTTPGPA